jgi:hypothetical protein
MILARSRTDPLIGHGRHFGRTIHAFCNIHSLLVSGITWMADSYEEPDESFTAEFVHPSSYSIVFIIDSAINSERREQRVFKSLLGLVPGLEAWLMGETTSEQDIRHIADLVSSSSIL